MWQKATGLLAVRAADLISIFGISNGTAYKIVNRIYDRAERQGEPIYQAGSQKAVPTEMLLAAYGYNDKTIARRAKRRDKQ